MSLDILFNIIKNTSKNFKCYFKPIYEPDYSDPYYGVIDTNKYYGREYTILFEDGTTYSGECTHFEEAEINKLKKYLDFLEHPEHYDYDVPSDFPKWFDFRSLNYEPKSEFYNEVISRGAARIEQQLLDDFLMECDLKLLNPRTGVIRGNAMLSNYHINIVLYYQNGNYIRVATSNEFLDSEEVCSIEEICNIIGYYRYMVSYVEGESYIAKESMNY